MILSRFEFYLFGLFIIFSPLVIYKVIWIGRSVTTTGTIISVTSKKSFRKSPRIVNLVIQFKAGDKKITFTGRYGAPFEIGDQLPIRYIPGNPINCRINKLWNCWAEVIIVNGFFLLLWSFLFFRNVISGHRFLITKRNIKKIE